MNPDNARQLKKTKTLGTSLWLPSDFASPHVHEWRVAHFSIVLPIWRGVGWVDETLQSTGRRWFDFTATREAWEYGRASGITALENPLITETGFVKPEYRSFKGYFKAFYNDSRSRYRDLEQAFGSEAFDVLTDRNNDNATRDTIPAEVFDKCGAAAHHLQFSRELGTTEFRLAGIGERVGPTNASNSEEDLYGPSTVRLDSVEILQFADFSLQSHVEKSTHNNTVVSTFMVLNVIAENLSSSSLNSISSSLSRGRRFVRLRDDTSRIEAIGQEHLAHTDPRENGVFTSRREDRTLRLLPYFVYLASCEIDKALERPCPSMIASDGGYLIRNPSFPARKLSGELTETFGIMPKRVAFAIPNPRDSQIALKKPGWRPAATTPKPLRDDSADEEWTLEEQWAWLICTGADAFVEVRPVQSREEAEQLVAARSGSWTMVTTTEGIGLARRDPASNEGTRYWSLASTRYVDLLVMEMRAFGAFKTLSNELSNITRLSGTNSVEFQKQDISLQHEIMRADLNRLEDVQRDFLTVRNLFWMETIPSREIDTKIMLALRDDFGITSLFHSVAAELDVRERIIHTQYDQLRIERNRERAEALRREERERVAAEQREQEAQRQLQGAETKRQNALNLAIAILAAALAGPDWADALLGDAAGWRSVVMAFAAGVITWIVLWRISNRVGDPTRED